MAEDRLAKLGEFIRAQRRMAELSLRQLADAAKVSNPYLSQIERGLYKPSAEILKAIAGALGISSEVLYTQAGLLDPDPDPGSHKTEDAIRTDPHLSTDQKEALIRVYRSFVQDDAPVTEPGA